MTFFTELFRGVLAGFFRRNIFRRTLCLLILFSSGAYAQTDTSFWFVAPEILTGGSNEFDKPIYLWLSSFSQPSTVTITQPANPDFTPIIVNVLANNSAVVDLTGIIDSIENKPADHVNNFGLHIRATNNISVYYEVKGAITCGICNGELYALKGRNALGTRFWTPFQKTYNNYSVFTPLPYASFNIVATEDATNITITPTKNIVGHAAGTPFNITLNKGQTFACEATSQAAAEHPSGSTVVSDKPIAVTVSDDYINISGVGQDTEGDQLIPADKIGTEYIVVNSPSAAVNDMAIIVATQNNTQVNVNGSLVTTINTGDTYQYSIGSNGAIYITTSAPAYVYQVTTAGHEAGGAIIPPLTCTGSQVVSVSRSSDKPFNVFLITTTGNENNFLLNGAPGIILASAFKSVPGTTNWLYARIDLSSNVANGAPARISNTSSLFAMGLMEGITLGSAYGYFSDFSTSNSVTVKNHCVATPVSDTLSASLPLSHHLWNTGDTTAQIITSQSGTYWVQNNLINCSFTDTFHITISGTTPTVSTGKDTVVCSGKPVQLKVNGTKDIFSWKPAARLNNPNIANPVATPDTTTTYVVTNSNACGIAADTIVVQVIPTPVISYLTPDDTICKGKSIQLIVSNNPNYTWSPHEGLSCTGCQLPVASPTITSTYYIKLSNDFCIVSDSVIITVVPQPPFIAKGDTTICIGRSVRLQSSSAISYSWIPSKGLSDTSIANPLANPSATTTYIVNAIGFCGEESDTVIIKVEPKPFIDVSSDTDICAGGTVQLKATGGLTYKWFPSDGLNNSTLSSPIANPQSSTTYTVVGSTFPDCFSSSNVAVQVLPYPHIDMPGPQQVTCGQGLQLTPSLNFGTFHWVTANGLTDSTNINPVVYPTQNTTYTLFASNEGCSVSATIEITVIKGLASLPNAFSPNRDGHNDIFHVLYSCGFNLDDFRIYNRWGELIFETQDIDAGWDGRYNGTDATVGVYVYALSGHKDNGEKVFMKGNVTLLR